MNTNNGWLDIDQQRLALWQAIQEIKIGNLHDDKVIVANLHRAGYVIAAAPAAPAANGWLDIASAPKDGNLILLGCPDEGPDGRPALSLPGYWIKGWCDAPDDMGQDDGWVDVQHTDFYPGRSFGNPDYMRKGSQPTHWMPLPAAPGTPPASAQDDAKDERQAFEAWAEDNSFVLDCDFFETTGQYYEDNKTQLAYDIWRAARSSVAAPAAGDALGNTALQKLFGEAITGALGFGAQGVNPPPKEHWLEPFWQMARADAVAGESLALLDHPLLRDVLGYIEDAGPADVWGAAQSWMALRDAASQQQEG